MIRTINGWRSQLYDYLPNARQSPDVYMFGVFTCQSIIEIGQIFFECGHKIERMFLFDSFVGMPKDDDCPWPEWKEGCYSTFDYFGVDNLEDCYAAITAKVGNYLHGAKLEFIPGFFNKSLTDETYNKFNMKDAAYIDVDVDLYSSTYEVLDFLFKHKIAKQHTLIGFDDFGSTPGWAEFKDGQAKATLETMVKHEVKFLELARIGSDYPQVQVIGAVL